MPDRQPRTPVNPRRPRLIALLKREHSRRIRDATKRKLDASNSRKRVLRMKKRYNFICRAIERELLPPGKQINRRRTRHGDERQSEYQLEQRETAKRTPAHCFGPKLQLGFSDHTVLGCPVHGKKKLKRQKKFLIENGKTIQSCAASHKFMRYI
jgi:hypothetical protein